MAASCTGTARNCAITELYLKMRTYKQRMDENERKNVIAALLVVVISIAAFVAYFANGGVVFWVVAIMALISGFYMAYRLSQEGKPVRTTAVQQQRAKKGNK